jgi:hypothetical protein
MTEEKQQTTDKENSLDKFWITAISSHNNKECFMMVLPIVGEKIIISDLYKMALEQDKEEGGVISFSFQKFSKQEFEEVTNVLAGDPCRFVCVRTFYKEDNRFVESLFDENDNKVKVRLVPLDKSIGMDLLINENPKPEEIN